MNYCAQFSICDELILMLHFCDGESATLQSGQSDWHNDCQVLSKARRAKVRLLCFIEINLEDDAAWQSCKRRCDCRSIFMTIFKQGLRKHYSLAPKARIYILSGLFCYGDPALGMFANALPLVMSY